MRRRRIVMFGVVSLVAGVIATYATAWVAVESSWAGEWRISRELVDENGWQGDQWHWPWPIPVPLERPTYIVEQRAWGVCTRQWDNFANSIYVFSDQAAHVARSNGLNPMVLASNETHRAPYRPRASILELRAGWPLASIRWWKLEAISEVGEVWEQDVGGMGTSLIRSKRRLFLAAYRELLPLRPIWPLFVANVVLWAAGFAGIFSGFAWLIHGRRRFRRRRQGLCLVCGYNLRGLVADGQCPECGTRHNLPPTVPSDAR